MPGSEPSRPELVRMMMDVFEEEALPVDILPALKGEDS